MLVSSVTLSLAIVSLTAASEHENQSVTMDEMKQVWTNTRVCKAKCNVKVVLTNATGEAAVPFGGSGSEKEVSKRRDENGVFARDCNTGMRLAIGTRMLNLFDDKAISIHPQPPERMKGLNNVVLQNAGDSEIQKEDITISLLHWLDPLATKYYSQLLATRIDAFTVSRDPDFGEVVRISQEDQAVETVTFSKKFDWRIVGIAVDFKGMPVRRTTYQYSWLNNELICDSISTKEFDPRSGTLLRTSEIEVAKVEFFCSEADIRLEIPPYSRVYDGTVTPAEEYLIRKDGSRRNFSVQERKLASTWSDLLESEENDLFSKIPFNWSRWYFFFFGIGVFGVGVYLYFRGVPRRG